eukprot:2402817-Alexandrium_andersonii.AAC.1
MCARERASGEPLSSGMRLVSFAPGLWASAVVLPLIPRQLVFSAEGHYCSTTLHSATQIGGPSLPRRGRRSTPPASLPKRCVRGREPRKSR